MYIVQQTWSNFKEASIMNFNKNISRYFLYAGVFSVNKLIFESNLKVNGVLILKVNEFKMASSIKWQNIVFLFTKHTI